MLDEKSAAIIMIAKDRYSEASKVVVTDLNLDKLDAIKFYLARYSGTALSYIEIDQVKLAIRDALIDLVNNASNPGFVITQLFDYIDRGYDQDHAMLAVMRRMQVKINADEYVNGFSDELTKPVDICCYEVGGNGM